MLFSRASGCEKGFSRASGCEKGLLSVRGPRAIGSCVSELLGLFSLGGTETRTKHCNVVSHGPDSLYLIAYLACVVWPSLSLEVLCVSCLVHVFM